jgi:hypothetical protein
MCTELGTRLGGDGSFNEPDLEDVQDWTAECGLEDIPVVAVGHGTSLMPHLWG